MGKPQDRRAQHLGDTLLDGIRLLPAALFYIVYIAGGSGSRVGRRCATALVNGAILDLVAYGMYELTNWTVMRDWHPAMMAADMALGAKLTAVSASAGVVAARAVGLDQICRSFQKSLRSEQCLKK